MRRNMQEHIELLRETQKYAWLLRLLYKGSNAAAQALGQPKQRFSDWVNGVHAANYKQVQAMKELVEAQPLSQRYQKLIEKLISQKGRQGQRSDLKKGLKPLPAWGCKGKRSGDKESSPLRLDADEVHDFSGRTDEWLAEMLLLPSKNSVHYLEKVVENQNAALTAKMDSRELTPYQAAEFVVLPLDLQNALLEKSRVEQIAGIKAWNVKQKQGGENKKG